MTKFLNRTLISTIKQFFYVTKGIHVDDIKPIEVLQNEFQVISYITVGAFDL